MRSRSCRVVLVFALVGCGSKPVPVAPPPDAAPRVPPTVAKLFVPGTTWSWPTAITTVGDDEQATETTTAGTLTCEVTATSPRPGGWNTRLTCKATPELPATFPTELAATPQGVWQLVEGSELDPKTRLIDEPPVERSSDTVHAEAEGSIGTSVRKHGTAWCFGEAMAAQGHVAEWTLCVRDGTLVGGVVTGNEHGFVTVSWGDRPAP